MKEYKFLKVARVVFKVLAWFMLALGSLVGIIVLITGTSVITPPVTAGGATIPPTPKAAGVVFIIMGALYFFIMYTISEIIGILLDLKGSCEKTV
jgi:hypothetical protein